MNDFRVQTKAQLAAAFLALVGNYEAAEIIYAPPDGGKIFYRLPDVRQQSPKKQHERDERLKTYAKNAKNSE